MQRTIWLLPLIAAVCLLGATAPAAAQVYVINGGATTVGTPISSVPYPINAPGFYFLTGNLNSSGSYAITVNADDVTLDLMGFSLSYTGSPGYWSVGVFMNGRSNVEVRNGTVQGFTEGCVAEYSTAGVKHRVVNVRALNGNGGHGIFLRGTGHLVENCTASNNNTGIWIDSGEISGCAAANNSIGIWLQGPGNLLDTTAFNNTSHNFYLGNGVATSLLADGNSAFGLSTNYGKPTGTTGVVLTANNAGTP
jgi:hypothetical protein